MLLHKYKGKAKRIGENV